MTRVLSLPGRNHANHYFSLFCDALESMGIRIVNIRDTDAWTFRFDICHIHFPTHFVTETGTLGAIFWSGFFSGLFLATKLLGKHIVYTVHNVVPFNVHREWLLWPYLRLVHVLCDGYVFLNLSSQAEFYARFPAERSKPCVVIPHGPYPVNALNEEDHYQKRREFTGEKDALLVGFLGNIKSYKNLGVLTSLPKTLGDGRLVRCVVAGRVEKRYREEAETILRQIPPGNLLRIDKPLSDEELNDLIRAVDVVMLSYSKGWNSGAAMLVLSNQGRILASDLPVFKELETTVGHPWVYTFASAKEAVSDSLVSVIEKIALDRIAPSDVEGLTRILDSRSFARGAEELRGFYTYLDGAPKHAIGLNVS